MTKMKMVRWWACAVPAQLVVCLVATRRLPLPGWFQVAWILTGIQTMILVISGLVLYHRAFTFALGKSHEAAHQKFFLTIPKRRNP